MFDWNFYFSEKKVPDPNSSLFTLHSSLQTVPIYEYKCANCGNKLEAMQKISDEPLKICPRCHEAKLEKQISLSGFQFKGTGWYVSDYTARGAEAKNESKSESKTETGGETKAEVKTESKPETKTETSSGGESTLAPAPASNPAATTSPKSD